LALTQNLSGVDKRHEEQAPGGYFVGRDELRVVKGRWPDSRSVSRKPAA
jgi:hypothetical protein